MALGVNFTSANPATVPPTMIAIGTVPSLSGSTSGSGSGPGEGGGGSGGQSGGQTHSASVPHENTGSRARPQPQ